MTTNDTTVNSETTTNAGSIITAKLAPYNIKGRTVTILSDDKLAVPGVPEPGEPDTDKFPSKDLESIYGEEGEVWFSHFKDKFRTKNRTLEQYLYKNGIKPLGHEKDENGLTVWSYDYTPELRNLLQDYLWLQLYGTGWREQLRFPQQK